MQTIRLALLPALLFGAVAGAQTITAPDTAKIGAPVTITLAGEYDSKDFLSIVAKGAQEGQYGTYEYAQSATVTLTAPDTPGSYEIRLLGAGSPYPTRASRPLTVEDVTVTLTAPDRVDAGAEFAVTWTGPGNAQDWISWAEAGADDKVYNDFVYTKQGNPLTLRAPDKAGQYEVRYFLGGSDRLIARRPLIVGAVNAELKAPAQVQAGADFDVAWTGPDNAGDFITLVEADARETDYAIYRYTTSGNPVTMRAPDAPGKYELRYATGQSYATIARAPIEVGGVTATLSAPAPIVANTDFAVKWTGPGNALDYITIAEKASDDASYVDWGNVAKGNPLTLRAPIAAGEYELRYKTGQSHFTLATAPLRVEPAAQKPGKLLVTGAPGLASGAAVEVILDASGSMLQRIGAQTRMDLARATLTKLVKETIPAGVPFALRVFGKDEGSCRSDLEIPLAPLDRATAAQHIAAIVAKNNAKTAIGASLEQSVSDLAAAKGERLLVLITDGEETCEGDPRAAIAKLEAAGVPVTLNIVGFAIDDAGLRAAFRQWSELAGGAYFDASDAAGLDAGVQKALRSRYEVVDATGRVHARGVVGGEAVELMPGSYTVRSGARESKAEINDGETSTVAL
jgi:hypothetical protein